MPRGQDPAPEPFFGNFGAAPPLHWDRLSLKEPRVFGGARHDQADRRSQRLSPQDAHTLCSIAADLRVTQTVDGNKGIHCVLAKSKLPARR